MIEKKEEWDAIPDMTLLPPRALVYVAGAVYEALTDFVYFDRITHVMAAISHYIGINDSKNTTKATRLKVVLVQLLAALSKETKEMASGCSPWAQIAHVYESCQTVPVNPKLALHHLLNGTLSNEDYDQSTGVSRNVSHLAWAAAFIMQELELELTTGAQEEKAAAAAPTETTDANLEQVLSDDSIWHIIVGAKLASDYIDDFKSVSHCVESIMLRKNRPDGLSDTEAKAALTRHLKRTKKSAEPWAGDAIANGWALGDKLVSKDL